MLAFGRKSATTEWSRQCQSPPSILYPEQTRRILAYMLPAFHGGSKVLKLTMGHGTTNVDAEDLGGIRLEPSDVGGWRNFFDTTFLSQVNDHAPTLMKKMCFWIRSDPPLPDKLAMWDTLRDLYQQSPEDTLPAGVWRALMTQCTRWTCSRLAKAHEDPLGPLRD